MRISKTDLNGLNNVRVREGRGKKRKLSKKKLRRSTKRWKKIKIVRIQKMRTIRIDCKSMTKLMACYNSSSTCLYHQPDSSTFRMP
jgi:hypothetical protein